MRTIMLLALAVFALAGCQTMTDAEYVKLLNADKRTWPPVVEGQAFPHQHMDGGMR